ncbi:uncharacterized protein [Macrobrachium rosenbergii]|uniref:uncharacterized protein isoform X1 n=2 Tax=Macrobrachium rosenbergii TaxID=79674 RepID=UPI0034D7683B
MSMKVTRPAASLKAAQEAAAKVTAMLVASGQLKPSELHKNKNKSSKSSDLFIEEVVINDAPMSARNFLTRSSTQEEISKMSGAAVSTRGRYMSQDELKNPSKNPSDRPLYLHIQAVNQQDVKVAVGRIMHIIMEHSHRKSQSLQRPRGPRPNPAPGLMGPRPGSGPRGPRPLVFRPPRPDMSAPPPQSHPPPPLTNIFREKVFLPVNIGLNPSEVRARLLGESGMNLRYIQEETGVVISIRGIGSGYLEHATGQEAQDTLHFYLEHDNQEQFNQAKDLVVNLAQTVIGEIQQQQQQQQQPPAPLFTHPPPQQPDVTLGAGGAVGQPHLASVPVAAHQLSAPQAPPPQILHSQMVPPQVPAHSQIVPPHVGPPQMAPTPVPMQGQLGGHAILAPHLQASGSNVSQEVLPQQEVIQGAVVTLSQQVVHLTAPPVVSTAAAVPNQQLVHTSSGTQLVTLPPGTQIINTSDGPRLVAIATGTQVTAPVAPVPVSHQSHTVPLHDPQAGPSSIIHQQPPPQTIPVSVTPNHLTINQPPVVSDGTAQSSGIARQLGVSNSFSTVMSNTVSTTSPHTNVGIHGNPEVTATYPPSVSVTLPPPSTSMAIGVPPPVTGLALAPGGTPTPANVCFVLTSGANTLTTTSGVGLLVNQDPSIPSAGHMNVSQPLVVAGVLPPTQQHHQQQQVAQAATAPSYLGAAPSQQLNPSGYPSQSVLEQPASTGYPPPDQPVQAYNPSNPSSATSQPYTQLQSQQPPRVVSVGYVPVNPANTIDGPPPTKMEYPGGAPGSLAGHLPTTSLQPQQGPKNDHLASGSPYYTPSNQSDQRPVALEQQWQQFQQQVKVEGGQQQYDPYSAADDTELHSDSSRQQQTSQIAHSASQQTSVSQTASQQTQAVGQHLQQSFNSFDPSGQQSTTGSRESEARASGASAKEDAKSHGTESPRSSYSFYYGQNQSHKLDASPERSELTAQPLAQNDQRYQNAHGATHSEMVPQSSPNQQLSGSPQTHSQQGQPIVGQVQYQVGQYQSGQYQGMYSQDPAQPKNQEESKPEHFQPGHQEEQSKLGNISESPYQQGLSPNLVPSSQASTLQGPPPQQQLLTQGPPPDTQYQLENQYQQGPPPVHPQQNQQYSSAQYAPGGQYPWAQYPQPSGGAGQYPPGPVTPNSVPATGTYPSGQVPFNGSGASSTSGPFAVAGSSDSCTFPGVNSGPGQFPVGPNGSGTQSMFPVVSGQAEKQQNFQDKKAEPGVARDVTASLLMPPPPPPSSSIPAQSTGVNSRGREESTDRSHKRQRSCSSQDEKMSPGRAGGVTDESASHEDSGSNRVGGSAGSVDGSTGSFSSPSNFQGGPGSFAAGGGNFMGGPPGPGAFSGGPGYMNPGGPWEWNPMPRPYGGLPVGPGPFSGPPNGPPSGPMGNPQILYNRGHRGDRDRDREDSGGSRRGGRGGGRGGNNAGGRWNREFRF